MFQKLIRALVTVFGGFLGYGVYLLCKLWLEKYRYIEDGVFTTTQETVMGIIIALIFALIFFRLTPVIRRSGAKIADNIEDDLSGVSANDIVTGVIGLIIGLVIAILITQIFAKITNAYIYVAIVIIIYVIMGYIGVVVATKKGKDVINQIINLKLRSGEENRDKNKDREEGVMSFIKSKKKSEGIPKIFDTSVIIDGRIAEIMKTGFLEGPIVIPEFVLVELRHIADSSDSLKRTRGRRGLDILNKIQEDYGISIYNTESEKSLKGIAEVDVKLLKLAQIMNGKVVTNDFNLNKVASINGIGVLNINELANTLKPVVIPGEELTVTLVKQGKDNSQAVAYLDDGTMIVVEDGRRMIGKTTDINVTSVLQTSAGRMIFGRLKTDKG